jgi:hypothetical protein
MNFFENWCGFFGGKGKIFCNIKTLIWSFAKFYTNAKVQMHLCGVKYYKYSGLKKTVPRDFRLQVFYMVQFPPSP